MKQKKRKSSGRPGRKRRVAAAGNTSTVTLEMVATAAGVSPSTVSRILNGTAGVRESKVSAVNTAIAKLRFTPNPMARTLAGGKSMSVGIVIQAIESPFYAEFLATAEKALFRAGYSVLFVSGHWREDDERRCIDHVLSRRVDGIILMTSCLPERELIQLSRNVPLVLTGRLVAGSHVFSLDVDNAPGARLATEYLIGQGHERIAFIAGPAEHPDSSQRLDGYKAALAAHKIPFSRNLVAAGNYTDAGGYAAMNRLLDSEQSFTAVFAANDQSACGAMLALHRRGLQVPDDVSVVGFDDLPSSSYTIPPLTTVHRSINEIAVSTADAVVELIEGRMPVTRATPATLAIRESTGPRRA